MLRNSSLLTGAVLLIAGAVSYSTVASAADSASKAKMPRQEQRAVDDASPARVDAQIKELHDKLHITAAQEDKWKDVAEAMRDTAKETRTKLTDRAEKVKTRALTAVDELHAYQDLEQVQYDGIKRLVGPFEKVYDSMTPEQKKNADVVFARPAAAAAGRPSKASAAE